MKLACILGGWHFPSHPFRRIPRLAGGADLFVVAHREEYQALDDKQDIRENWAGETGLRGIDYEMYSTPLRCCLGMLGWEATLAPNTSGDWTFFNQWLDTHDYRKYDVILNCHDDTYFRPGVNVFDEAIPMIEDGFVREGQFVAPLMIANGRYPESSPGYVRGSFEFWTRELLDMLGGRIPIPELSLNREGLTDTPKSFETLMAWNAIGDPLRKFFCDQKLTDRVVYLSEYYRVSPWVIEGERGLISSNIGAPWSFNAGLEKWPL